MCVAVSGREVDGNLIQAEAQKRGKAQMGQRLRMKPGGRESGPGLSPQPRTERVREREGQIPM